MTIQLRFHYNFNMGYGGYFLLENCHKKFLCRSINRVLSLSLELPVCMHSSQLIRHKMTPQKS